MRGQHTQEYVAERLNIAPATYSRWENGKYSISAEDLSRVASILEVDVSHFYQGSLWTETREPDLDHLDDVALKRLKLQTSIARMPENKLDAWIELMGLAGEGE